MSQKICVKNDLYSCVVCKLMQHYFRFSFLNIIRINEYLIICYIYVYLCLSLLYQNNNKHFTILCDSTFLKVI